MTKLTNILSYIDLSIFAQGTILQNCRIFQNCALITTRTHLPLTGSLFFLIKTSNLGAEAECSHILLRCETENDVFKSNQ